MRKWARLITFIAARFICTSRMALSMLVVTPSPSRRTRQLLIGWREPLRRVAPFFSSDFLHTSKLSPTMKRCQMKLTKRSPFYIFCKLLSTFSVHSLPPCSSSHLFVCEWVQQASIECRRSNNDPPGWKVNPWRQSGGGRKDSDQALAKSSFQHVTLVKGQTCRKER